MNEAQDVIWREAKPLAERGAADLKKATRESKLNLYSLMFLRPFIQNPWPQYLVRAFTLAGFVFAIAAGLFGSQVGSHNFAIIFVWIAWWTALKLVFIPFGGRSWCSVCPIPLPGEWLQRGGILVRRRGRFGLNLRWPKKLKGSWLQSGGFLLIGLFSAVTLTDPSLTAWIFLAIFSLAIALSLVFEKRSFCSYLCPIGGFSGMYARTAPVEVRVLDNSVCAAHQDKTCYQACPWGLYPVALRDSSQCGLCMECLRACPHDNLAFNLRPFGSDLVQERPSRRLDETFLALVMLGSALAFSAVFTGPWGILKMAAFDIGSNAWILYSLAFLVLNLVLLPAAYLASVWAGLHWSASKANLRQVAARFSPVLLPLGLFSWIAFTLSFAIPKLNLVRSVASDPFGWGWNLLGNAGSSTSINLHNFIPTLEALLVLVGLLWSADTAQKLSRAGAEHSLKKILPLLAFCLAFSLAMIWLLVG